VKLAARNSSAMRLNSSAMRLATVRKACAIPIVRGTFSNHYCSNCVALTFQTGMLVFTYTCLHVCVYVCVGVCMCVGVCVCVHACVLYIQSRSLRKSFLCAGACKKYDCTST